jgi:hypothetical protein
VLPYRRWNLIENLGETLVLVEIEKLGPEEPAELWTWFQEAEEIDELVAAVDEGIQAAEVLQGERLPRARRRAGSGTPP